MNRFQTIWLPIFLAWCAVAGPPLATSNAQDANFLDQELTPELIEQYELKLNAILKTRTDQEKVFIAQLVANMKTGAVPIKLVSTSFKWVQQNRPKSNYPFIYFEKVLRLQADKIGVADAIPPFDFEVFRSSGQRELGQQLDAGQQTDLQNQSLFETARTRIGRLFRRFPGGSKFADGATSSP